LNKVNIFGTLTVCLSTTLAFFFGDDGSTRTADVAPPAEFRFDITNKVNLFGTFTVCLSTNLAFFFGDVSSTITTDVVQATEFRFDMSTPQLMSISP
jgi:hypothetical protein